MTSVLQLLRLLQDFHIIPVLLNRQAVANVFKACKVVSRNVVTNDEVSGAQFSLLYLLYLYKPGVLCASSSAWQRRYTLSFVRTPRFRIRNRVTILNSGLTLNSLFAGLTLEGFVRFIEGVAAASNLPVLEKRMLKEHGRSLSLLDKFHYLTGVFFFKK